MLTYGTPVVPLLSALPVWHSESGTYTALTTLRMDSFAGRLGEAGRNVQVALERLMAALWIKFPPIPGTISLPICRRVLTVINRPRYARRRMMRTAITLSHLSHFICKR